MKHSKGKTKVHPIHKRVHVAEEYAPADFFGRFDTRMNRLIQHLFEQGMLTDVTDKAFGDAIGRSANAVFCWRTFRSFPNSVSLVLIHRAFGVDMHWMCGLKGQTLSQAFDKSHTQGRALAKAA
ncbi:MAG: hypothetical protein ACW99U_12940 [Candidatus Thorarchaeota archaeon]|jgi:hypothetical protein